MSSALGGLIVAAVLKYADSVLKGYATAASVILTGVLSAIFFGTVLDTHFFLAVVTVTCSISLYQTPPPPPPEASTAASSRAGRRRRRRTAAGTGCRDSSRSHSV